MDADGPIRFAQPAAMAGRGLDRADELRERDAVLAEEQAALRRVAAVVAGGAVSADVFAAVTEEVGKALGLPYVDMLRYEPDGTATVIGAWGEREHPFEVGTSWALDGPTITARVRETGAPARVDDYAEVPGAFADTVRSAGIRAAAGAPIVVDGALWGVMVTAADSGPLPDRIEQRLAGFTELVAIALSQTQAREQLRQLAEEQSALRRVATLVAQGALPPDVFAAVAAEVAQLLDLPLVEMSRYEPDGTATVIGASGEHAFATGTNWTLDGPSLAAEVRRTGRPARVDDYADVPGSIGDAARATGVHAGVGAPVVVGGEVWGVVSAGGPARVPLPPGAEDRLAQFTELVATAISNAQAREDLQRLADEQAALRRVATLVAEDAEPRAIFDAVADETGRLLGATTVNLVHFTPDGISDTVAGWSVRAVHVPHREPAPDRRRHDRRHRPRHRQAGSLRQLRGASTASSPRTCAGLGHPRPRSGRRSSSRATRGARSSPGPTSRGRRRPAPSSAWPSSRSCRDRVANATARSELRFLARPHRRGRRRAAPPRRARPARRCAAALRADRS